MAHEQQREFLANLRAQIPEAFTNVKVLEIGSLDINGSVRDFFTTENYLGVDVGPGPGVDVVAQGENLTYPDNSFDVVISAECFEHNPEWVATFRNMIRMADKFIIMTCASDGRAEHGTTKTTPQDSPHTIQWDYYRNLNEQDFRDQFDMDNLFTEYQFTYNPHSKDLYFWGKPS